MATTRKPSVPKTSADILKEIAAAKSRLATLEKQLYSEEIDELLKQTNIVADFAKVRLGLNSNIPTLVILSSIAAAVGLKRVLITTAEPAKRKPADPNKPKKPRKAKVQPA